MKKLALLALLSTTVLAQSCSHEVVETVKAVINDTTQNGGGGGGTGGGGNTNPCDPTKIYFVNDVLPIFLANCGYSGCHDVGTAADGVVLDNYFNILNTGGIIPGNAHNSEVYEKIVDTDPNDVMPPAPKSRLSSDQISLIARWINEGAQNTECINSSACDTLNVTFAVHVQNIVKNNCIGCHSGTAPSGGISLTNYTEIKAAVNNGSLLASIKHETGWSSMPKNRAKLSDCNVRQIEIWVAAGSPNN